MRWWLRDLMRTGTVLRGRALLLTAVMAADVALVAAAFGHGGAQQAAGLPPVTDLPAALTTAYPTGAQTTADAPGAGRTAAAGQRPPTLDGPGRGDRGGALAPVGFDPRALSVSQLTPDVAIRVRAEGDCATGGAAVALTTDNGHVWRDLRAPVQLVLRVVWTDPESGWLIGAGADCRPVYLRTDDAGRTWSRPRTTKGTWHRLVDPAARQMHAPRGTVSSPCPAGVRLVDLAGMSFSGSVALCAGGRVYRTADGGKRWRPAGQVPGALALAFSGSAAGLAVSAGGPTCALRVHRSADQGTTWRPAGCVPGTGGPGVGIALTDAANGMLVAGARVYSTTDGGNTWRRR